MTTERPLDLRELETLVAVAEEGSFTAAARRLGTNQPTVSGRIASLESQLAVRLFDRRARSSSLTPAGEAVLPRVRALLRDAAMLRSAARRFIDEPSGTLAIGASTIPAAHVLPRYLAQLRAKAPRIDVRLSVEGSDRAVDSLRRGDVELAVVGMAVPGSEFESFEVGQDRIVAVATQNFVDEYALEGDVELESVPLILREPGSATRTEVLGTMGRSGGRTTGLNVVLEVASNEAARGAALADLGVTFVSQLVVERHLADGDLVLVNGLAEHIERPIVAVSLRERTPSPPAALLLRLLGATTTSDGQLSSRTTPR